MNSRVSVPKVQWCGGVESGCACRVLAFAEGLFIFWMSLLQAGIEKEGGRRGQLRLVHHPLQPYNETDQYHLHRSASAVTRRSVVWSQWCRREGGRDQNLRPSVGSRKSESASAMEGSCFDCEATFEVQVSLYAQLRNTALFVAAFVCLFGSISAYCLALSPASTRDSARDGDRRCVEKSG
ncbi:hypothetical protein BC830DRAFT_1118746 [Chytriomyces sp. MP71]|nr:hypothetical protein BC830DRAFT_1118746 [Chytriomyces sp. MP71]